MPTTNEQAPGVHLIPNRPPCLEVLAIHVLDVLDVDIGNVLGPVRLPAEVPHQPLERLVVALQRRRVQVIGPVQGRVEVQSRPVLARGVQVRPLLDAAAVRVGQEARCVGHAYLEGRMHPQATAAEGDAVLTVVAIARLQVVEPARQPPDGLGPLAQWDSPLVDVLAVQAVHEQGLALRLDGGGGAPVGEAVLQAEDEPLNPRQDARHVMGQPQEVVVHQVAQGAVVAVARRVAMRLSGHIGGPDHRAAGIGEPPDADEVAAVPEGGGPVAEHDGVGVDGLGPLERVGRGGLELDLDDNTQGAERQQRGAKKLVVLGAAARAGLAVGSDDHELHDRLADERVAQG